VDTWILIQNGNVIDGAGNPPVEGTSVLIHNNLIEAIAKDMTPKSVSESLMARGDALTEIDAAGKTVMPGLIDAHCHLSFGHPLAQEEMDLYTGVELRTLRTAWNAKRILRAGVTSISQPGSSYYIGVGLREAINEGIVEGPRIFTAGRQISTSNGIGDYYPDTVGVPDGSVGVLANTTDEMKREVRIEIKNGVDLIKIADSPFGEFQAFTDDEIKMITDLTHQMRKKVTIHARGNDETRAAVRAGVDWIMHANIMDDQTVDELAQSEILLVPVLALLANWADFGKYVGVPQSLQDATRDMVEKSADSYHRAKAAGVRFGIGSEAGFAITPCGEWHARELELLVDYAGLTPLEAIQAGTQNVAMTVGLDGQVGTIAPGMLADVIVVEGNPAANIRILQEQQNILTVIKDGKVVDFSDPSRLVLRPYEPNQLYQTEMLMFDTVYGDPDERQGLPEPLPWDADDGRSLAGDIKKREVAAARETGTYAMGLKGPAR
jgi:imidazolonepropionase-like amidohydrolase